MRKLQELMGRVKVIRILDLVAGVISKSYYFGKANGSRGNQDFLVVGLWQPY